MEKKGIKLTTLIIILIILVCVEGIYIVNLKTNNATSKEISNNIQEENAKNKTSNKTDIENDTNKESMQKSKSKMDKEYVAKNETEINQNTNADVLKSLGYDINLMADNILDNIEKYASESFILKSTTGDINAEKLTIEEVKKNRESYKEKILRLLNEKDIVIKLSFENNTVVCTYDFEAILNSLELGSHMYIGIETDDEGYKTFEF